MPPGRVRHGYPWLPPGRVPPARRADGPVSDRRHRPQWAEIDPLPPDPACLAGRGGRWEKHCRRLIVDAILYVVDNGIKRQALPADFPPWPKVCKRFVAWRGPVPPSGCSTRCATAWPRATPAGTAAPSTATGSTTPTSTTAGSTASSPPAATPPTRWARWRAPTSTATAATTATSSGADLPMT
ncbi:transposase [Saccharothrix sp. CB00851]|uniref:transposase n=1 Tax=Saccharothrix sp. CB00851 TaxID=1835005 RepID=UPI00093DF63A